jgi:hypothetical protein
MPQTVTLITDRAIATVPTRRRLGSFGAISTQQPCANAHGTSIMALIAIVSTILASHTKPTQRQALSYLMLLVLAICVLLFLCSFVVLTQHSQWFNA